MITDDPIPVSDVCVPECTREVLIEDPDTPILNGVITGTKAQRAAVKRLREQKWPEAEIWHDAEPGGQPEPASVEDESTPQAPSSEPRDTATASE